MNKSPPRGDCHGLGAIPRSKLFHDVLDVNLDRFFGDEEPLCDIAIPISTGNVVQNVDLTIRERFVGEMLGEVRSDFRRDVLFPLVDFANRLNHLFGGHALQQVPLGSRLQGALDVDVAGRAG